MAPTPLTGGRVRGRRCASALACLLACLLACGQAQRDIQALRGGDGPALAAIEPGSALRFGGVRVMLGTTAGELQPLLGEPGRISPSALLVRYAGGLTAQFADHDADLLLDPSEVVIGLRVDSGYAGQTSDGLGVGSALAELDASHGPLQLRGAPPQPHLLPGRAVALACGQGVAFLLDDALTDTAAGVAIFAPTRRAPLLAVAADGAALLLDGLRLVAGAAGTPRAAVHSALGLPDETQSRGCEAPSCFRDHWLMLGLEALGAQDGVTERVAALIARWPLAGSNPEAVAPGASRAAIEAAWGAPVEVLAGGFWLGDADLTRYGPPGASALVGVVYDAQDLAQALVVGTLP